MICSFACTNLTVFVQTFNLCLTGRHQRAVFVPVMRKVSICEFISAIGNQVLDLYGSPSRRPWLHNGSGVIRNHNMHL